MPVDVDVHDPNRLRVTLIDQNYAHQLNILLSSLLTTQLHRNGGFWTLTWHDFTRFRVKLEQLGLTEGRTATDQAVQWIKDQEAADAELVSIKEGKQNHLVTDLKLKLTPYEDQIAGIRFLLTRKGAILADEMGVGKTLQLLSAFQTLRQQGHARHMLVVCPNSVKSGWTKEVNKHTHLSSFALGNGTQQVTKDFETYKQNRTDVLITHYDSLVANLVDKSNQLRMQSWSKLVDDFLKLPWDVIVLDEAHQVKTSESKRTQAALHLTQAAKDPDGNRSRVFLATGTPVSESPLDAWSVLTFLDPKCLPKSYSKFENHFVIKIKQEGRFKVWTETAGYKNLSDLKAMLHRVMMRRLKSDIKGMPDRVEQIRYVQMNGSQKQLYDDIKRGLYDSVVQNPDDKLSIAFALTKCIRLRQVLNHPSLVDKEGESAKYVVLDEILDEVLSDPSAKVMIWTEFRKCVELLSNRYRKRYGVIELTGSCTQDQLKHYSTNFDTMKERVAIGIPMFGGTGIDFLNRCRTAIYVEPPFSTILFRQSMDRIHRRVGEIKTEIDQIKSSPATLIFLEVAKSLDELVYRILGQKGSLVDAMLIEDEKLLKIGKAELLEYLK